MTRRSASFRQLNTALLSRAVHLDEEAQSEYRASRSAVGYWMMADLKASAAYREDQGQEPSYRRARVFANIINELADRYPDVEKFKDLGDGVLLRSESFRSALEITLLMDGLAQYWAAEVLRDANFPSMYFRTAITSGACVKVGNDYLGNALDRVARLSGFKSDDPSVIAIVDDGIFSSSEQIDYEREYPAIQFSTPFTLPDTLQKAGERPRFVSTISVDRKVLRDFSDYFAGAAWLLDPAEQSAD